MLCIAIANEIFLAGWLSKQHNFIIIHDPKPEAERPPLASWLDPGSLSSTFKISVTKNACNFDDSQSASGTGEISDDHSGTIGVLELPLLAESDVAPNEVEADGEGAMMLLAIFDWMLIFWSWRYSTKCWLL
ncbi:hypothetical protein OGATHE_005104 [Ogataea polymorpha]|uniref:Uncharacterized protein n=1 Tax=Ogataea polymorpha TaxID=460523 RepID=A0A9P8NWK9_9ASCO|nr:hypothetical protein OGATHE_005104 [Ogataea polymorpha]